MRIFALALSSLCALAPVAAQQGMRGTTKLTSSKELNDAEQHLLTAVQSIGESSCMQIDDEGACNGSVDTANVQCVWCKCSAIPSECLSVEQSKAVPSGVFDCASPPDTPEEASFITSDGPQRLNYSLKDGAVDGSLCDPNSKSLSGYMDITGSEYDANGENKHLFYWFFEKRATSQLEDKEEEKVQNAKDIPIILWLTGGPGCSSTLALLFENGPCKVSEDGHSTTINPYSWTEAAHVLWLDQPAGVGYSYGKESDYNEEMISEDAYYFLQEFYKEHPEYSENPLTIVGESYGGHYAPAVAHKVWSKNKMSDDSMLQINLAGLAVGNGLTDPAEQYKWYPEMAVHNSHGIKVLPDDVYQQMKDAVPKCVSLIEECNAGDSFVNKFACQTAFILCNTAETTPYQMTGMNPYDIRKKCEVMPLCYDFSNVETFLNLDSTKEALHISEESNTWKSCNMGINLKFHSDWMKDFSPFVADLLNDGIPALIYAGDVDYICNYLGNRAWTLGLDWMHKSDFNSAEDHEWGESDSESGSVGLSKTSNGFTFLQVYDAGHMVPNDQPKAALNMIRNFVMGGEF
jgi:cathepsin A (carboxypeptidase C)